MPVLAAARDRSVMRTLGGLVTGLSVGMVLLGGGLLLGYLLLAGGIIEHFAIPARPTPVEMAIGILAWTFALVVPAGFAVVGALRLMDTLGIARQRPRVRPAARVAGSMPADHLVASRVRLPDGRIVPELIVGPFGVVVVGELPPAGASRHHGGRWEIHQLRNVSQSSGRPESKPRLNQLTRWAEVPWVNPSGCTPCPDIRWMRSSPTAAAAPSPSSTSPASRIWRCAVSWPHTPA